jgi:hypothetical protein
MSTLEKFYKTPDGKIVYNAIPGFGGDYAPYNMRSKKMNITEGSPTAYVVKVFGQVWGQKHATQQLAEAAIMMLPQAHQEIAEIVAVQRDTGKELLLG